MTYKIGLLETEIGLLDVFKIMKYTEKKAVETSDYRKSTFNGAFTNFKSLIPMAYKIGLLETEIGLLDVFKIMKYTEKKAVETSDYRKSTFNGTFTNFKSLIPMAYKIGLLETEIGLLDVISLFFNILFLRKLS